MSTLQPMSNYVDYKWGELPVLKQNEDRFDGVSVRKSSFAIVSALSAINRSNSPAKDKVATFNKLWSALEKIKNPIACFELLDECERLVRPAEIRNELETKKITLLCLPHEEMNIDDKEPLKREAIQLTAAQSYALTKSDYFATLFAKTFNNELQAMTIVNCPKEQEQKVRQIGILFDQDRSSLQGILKILENDLHLEELEINEFLNLFEAADYYQLDPARFQNHLLYALDLLFAAEPTAQRQALETILQSPYLLDTFKKLLDNDTLLNKLNGKKLIFTCLLEDILLNENKDKFQELISNLLNSNTSEQIKIDKEIEANKEVTHLYTLLPGLQNYISRLHISRKKKTIRHLNKVITDTFLNELIKPSCFRETFHILVTNIRKAQYIEQKLLLLMLAGWDAMRWQIASQIGVPSKRNEFLDQSTASLQPLIDSIFSIDPTLLQSTLFHDFLAQMNAFNNLPQHTAALFLKEIAEFNRIY